MDEAAARAVVAMAQHVVHAAVLGLVQRVALDRPQLCLAVRKVALGAVPARARLLELVAQLCFVQLRLERWLLLWRWCLLR